MLEVWKTRAEIYIGNTIDYDVKPHQVKTTIVKFRKAHIKILNLNCSQKKKLVWPTSMWLNKTNLNKKKSRKRFQIWIGKM